MKVLIIDDEPLVSELLKRTVDWDKLGLDTVESVESAENAHSLFGDSRFDIGIFDICMPGVSGLDLAAECIEKGFVKSIIFLTGHQEFEYARRALQLGAVDYVTKPIDKIEIERALEKAIKSNIVSDFFDFKSIQWQGLISYATGPRLSDSMDVSAGDQEYFEAPWGHEYLVLKKGDCLVQSIGLYDARKKILAPLQSPAADEPLAGTSEARSLLAAGLYTALQNLLYKRLLAVCSGDTDFVRLLKSEACLFFNSLSDIIDVSFDPGDKEFSGEMLVQLIKSCLDKIIVMHRAENEKPVSPLITAVMEWVHSNVGKQEISLSLAAAEFQVNSSYLSRKFRQETGEGFLDFFDRSRIEFILKLMQTTDLRSYEIGEMAGISDSHYFSVYFKKKMGISISEYKKQLKK